MNKLEINYKYKVGQVVFFMHKNEIRKGIVASISINIESKTIATYLTKKIIDKVISIFDKDYPFEEIWIRYSLDLVSKSGDFESSTHLLEHDVYENINDIVEALISDNV